MDNTRNLLKSEFKNYIGNELKIYYSKNRPITEILISLENKGFCDNGFIWENNQNIFISYKEINHKDLYELELKEFDFNFMDFNKEGFIQIDYNELFNICCYDLKELLKPYNATIKHIIPSFKNCLSVSDYITSLNKLVKEEFNKQIGGF